MMRGAAVWLLALVAVLSLATTESAAHPGFSRQNDLTCRACHTVWPNLNGFGREFVVNGFRLEPGERPPDHLQKLDEHTWIEKLPFLSGKINGRLYDKSENQDRRLNVFHELELFFSGNAANNFSFHATIEAEDEPSEFGLFFDEGFAGWHPRQQANVVVGWAQILAMDPYNSFAAGNRKITRSEKSPLTASFDPGPGTGFALRENTQFAAFYGKAGGFYYRAGFGTGNNDFQGRDDEDILVRLAYDFPVLKTDTSDSGLAFGGLWLSGRNKSAFGAGLDQDFTRAGVDFNLEAGNFQAYGLWMTSDSDIDPAGAEVSNDAYFVEALYLFERNDRPLFFPIARWESVERANGAEKIDAVAVTLGGYLKPNVDIKLEYFKTVKHPNPASETYRVTLFFNIGL